MAFGGRALTAACRYLDRICGQLQPVNGQRQASIPQVPKWPSAPVVALICECWYRMEYGKNDETGPLPSTLKHRRGQQCMAAAAAARCAMLAVPPLLICLTQTLTSCLSDAFNAKVPCCGCLGQHKPRSGRWSFCQRSSRRAPANYSPPHSDQVCRQP